MLRTILKTAFFVLVVLLLGQITVGNETVGQKVESQTLNATRWAGTTLSRSAWFASVAWPQWLVELFAQEKPGKVPTRGKSSKSSPTRSEPDEEGISGKDRSLIEQLLN